MEPNDQQQQFDNTGNADEIRKEMQQAQQQARMQQAEAMDGILQDVADNMDKNERDIRDDGRRHQDMKDSLTALQQQLKQLMQQ